MLDTDVPPKFTIPFAKNAVSADIRPIPVTTADPAAASLDAGFPPETFAAIAAGGQPPNGADFNGIHFQSTSWDRWFSAGGPIKYDATFQADAGVGGYPKGAVVQSATTFGLFFFCLVNGNTTNPDTGGAGWQAFNLNVVPATGSYLTFVSTSQILLAPRDGGQIWINGLNYAIPAGLAFSNSGLAASTVYYCYGYVSGGAVTIELSTTGFVYNANGMPQKAADPTRTFLGWVCTSAAGAFQKQGVGVVSYFNPVTIALQGATITNRSYSASGAGEVGGGDARVPFFSSGLRAVQAQLNFICSNDVTGNSVAVIPALQVGGTQLGIGQMYSFAAGANSEAKGNYSGTPPVGPNYMTIFGAVSNGDGFYTGSISMTVWG